VFELTLTLLVPFGLGCLLLQRSGFSWREESAAYAGYAWMVGSLGVAVGTLLASLARVPTSWWVVVAPFLGGALGCAWIHLARIRDGDPVVRRSRLGTLLTLFLLGILAFAALKLLGSTARPILDTDEASIWALKAKVLFLHPMSSQAFGDWIHDAEQAEYPLMDPLIQAWSYAVHGSIGYFNSRLGIQLFFVAILLILFQAMRRCVPGWAAAGLSLLLVTDKVFLTYFGLGHADVLVAAGGLLVLDSWLRYRENPSRAWIGLASCGLAIMVWSKPEGTLYFLAIATAVWITQGRLLRGSWGKIGFVVLPALCLLAFGILQNASLGLANHLMFPEGASFLGLFTSQFTDRVPRIASYFVAGLVIDSGSRVLTGIFLASLLFSETRRNEALKAPTLAIGIALFGTHAVYVGSYLDLDWHLEHSYRRVMLQLTPAACLWFALLSKELAIGRERERGREIASATWHAGSLTVPLGATSLLALLLLLVLQVVPQSESTVDASDRQGSGETTREEVLAWHRSKDSGGGPTFAGSASWRKYLELVERESKTAGLVDLIRNPWTYSRWFTSEWPNDSGWSLEIEGERIPLSGYGPNSGGTTEDGREAQLVRYTKGMDADELTGRIVVVTRLQTEDGKPFIDAGDYEFLSDPQTFEDPRNPLAGTDHLSPWGRMFLSKERKRLINGGALGMLVVFGLSRDALGGTYLLPVPRLHDLPTLLLDEDAGRRVLDAAAQGKKARLRLVARLEQVETYQLIGYLPGRNYGTSDDEQLLFVTHTDGPSISQDNGALGMLAVARHFAAVPRAERPRTLCFYFDCRHFMPGQEKAFSRQDWTRREPEFFRPIVGVVGVEHLGQVAVRETADHPFGPAGMPEFSSIWAFENETAVAIAARAIQDNELRRTAVQSPGRIGIHGRVQPRAWGLASGIIRERGIPGFTLMGGMTAYWSSKARMSYLDPAHFLDQVAVLIQLTDELMRADMSSLSGGGG